VAAQIAAALRRLGLSPGTGCELGDGLAAVDVGVLVGNPPVQVGFQSLLLGPDLLQRVCLLVCGTETGSLQQWA
jgi:hypothetical protein